MKNSPAITTKDTTATLMITSTPVNRPESLVPSTPITVSPSTIAMAPRSGFAESPASQVGRSNRSWRYADQPRATPRRTQGELEHEVPADDPGDELTQRRVREGVRAAGHRHGRGELGVAEPGEPAGDSGDDERDDDRR